MSDIRLGGPDPFPEEEGGCRDLEHGYRCTRSPGHEPPHVAVAGPPLGDVVVAVWPPYQEATEADLAGAIPPPPSGHHRPPEQVAADVAALMTAAQAKDQTRVETLIDPYFTEYDWCCLFSLAGGLLGRARAGLPPVPPGVQIALGAKRGASRAEIQWGRMLVAYLAGDMVTCADLFMRAVSGGFVGEMMAFGVVATSHVDRRRKAMLS